MDSRPPAAAEGPASATLRRLIGRTGPVSFSTFMETALYGEGVGFFATGGSAGRSDGDFVTSPEVGPLFGACIARALDRWWDADGQPDPFVVVEAGAGDGTLAREVLRAAPRCARALRYVLVERSARLRAAAGSRLPLEPASGFGPFTTSADDEMHPVAGRGPIFTSIETLPTHGAAVVLANELLDNLVFDVAQRESGWHEVRVAVRDGRFAEILVPLPEAPLAFADVEEPSVRVPLPVGLSAWLSEARRALAPRGRLVVIDYVVSPSDLVARSPHWLRSYRRHGRPTDVLAAPGSADITADVVDAQLASLARRVGLSMTSRASQADWLGDLGIGELVDEGRRVWTERAALGDLEAIAGRSRAVEAAALTDPDGLGGFTVVELSPSA